jgi:hypothetical protein
MWLPCVVKSADFVAGAWPGKIHLALHKIGWGDQHGLPFQVGGLQAKDSALMLDMGNADFLVVLPEEDGAVWPHGFGSPGSFSVNNKHFLTTVRRREEWWNQPTPAVVAECLNDDRFVPPSIYPHLLSSSAAFV